jgi:DNA-binding transcriptional LysR family regulator
MAASLRQLRAYSLLLEERNFTRAAAAMHLSQPAFSALIGGLEQSLGVRLFDRSKRHVAPTVEGADFEAAARRVLAEFDTAIARIHDRAALPPRPGLAGAAAVACRRLAASGRARALPGELPGITVEVADVLSEPCIERVTTMRADFALAAVRAEDAGAAGRGLCADDFHLVCRADHPLAVAKSIKVRDLAAWPFIHLSRSSSVASTSMPRSIRRRWTR